MKRLPFLAALFGGGAAKAQLRTPEPGLGCEVNERYAWDKETQSLKCARRYANNECPVCGTMAEPWSRPIHRKGEMMPTICEPHCLSMIQYYDKDTPYGPTERITRCRTCNLAFWHDAEGK